MSKESTKWWSLIQRELDGESYTRYKKKRKEAKTWYQNQGQYSAADKASWDSGVVVRSNLFQRDIDILAQSGWAEEPRFTVLTDLNDPRYQRGSTAFQAMLTKAWNETKANSEVEMAYLEALFGNVSYVALDFDRHRQLPSVRWVNGDIVIDPKARGRLKRANWVAEIIERPFMEFYNDRTIPKEKRDAVHKKMMSYSKSEKFSMDQDIRLAYIWSKNGQAPWKTMEGRKHIILTDVLDEPLLVEDWPWPFLEPDEFPIYKLELRTIPDSPYGMTMFEALEPLYRAFNWAATFTLTDAKKAATRKLFYNEGKINEPEKLSSGKHLEPVATKGNPGDAIHLQDYGSGSPVVYRVLEFIQQMHDQQSGVSDIVRGQSPGGRTTAEEVRTLQRNASVVFNAITRKLDAFLQRVIHSYMLGIFYYVPQWSRKVDGMGGVAEFVYMEPQPASVDPMGNPVPEMPGQWMPMQVGEEELAGLASPEGRDPGYVIRPGVDSWIGVDHALAWIEYDIEQLKRDFTFSVEVGSARADHSMEEQRTALTLMQSLMPIYQQYGATEQIYELLKFYITSFRVPNSHRFLPPMETFLMGQPPSFTPEPGKEDKASPVQQPAAQTLGMGFGAEGLRGFGTPEQVKRNDVGISDRAGASLA